MEIREQLTTAEVLRLAQSECYQSRVPDEILSYFKDHFNFNIWKWDDKQLFWQYLDDFYPLSTSYQEALIYINDIDKKRELIESISWLINTLQNEQASGENQKIAFELACLLPKFGEISYEEGIAFSHSSKKLAMEYLSNLKIELSTRSNASINDKEIIDNLKEHLVNKRWTEIAENYWQLESIYEYLFVDFHQLYSFIYHHYKHEILSFINQETNVWNLLYWLTHLPEKYLQPFTLQTTNNLAKFLLLFRLNYLSRNEMRNEQLRLSDIWQDCPDEWFYVFNQHALRYPYLQLGFGAFLINATDEKIGIYIDSLYLNENEDSIKDCLEYFFAHSNENRIQYLCNRAYEKWKDWDFDNSYSLRRSVLDRALVRYFQMFVSKQDRKDFIQNEINQILNFQQKWFTSIVELDKFVYLHLSRMQPACFADELHNKTSLSFEDFQKKFYYPNQFENDFRWKNWINLEKFNLGAEVD